MSTPAVAVPEPVRRRGAPRPTTGTPDRVLRLPLAALLAAAGGIALALAFPGTGWWPLAPVGVAAISLATRARRHRSGALLGLIAGLAFFVPHLHWSGVYVGNLPWLALAGLESAFFALLGLALPLAWRSPGGRVGTVLATSGLWVAQEALRGRVPFGGFPWGRLAFSQADAPTLGYAALGGAPAVTAAVAAGGACLAVTAVHLARLRTVGGPGDLDPTEQDPTEQDPTDDRNATGQTHDRSTSRTNRRRTLVAAAATLLAGAAVLTGGTLVPRPTSAADSAEVAAVQGNVPQPGLEFNARRRAVLDNHVTATAHLADQVAAGHAPRPDVVLWPENASDIDPLREPDAAAAIQSAADRVGVPLLVGAVLDQPAGHLSNAGIIWGPTGGPHPGPGAMYVKRHPAPFGEYIPYRSFFRIFSDKVDLVRRDFAAGSWVGTLPVGKIRIGDVICFEVAYDGLVRDPVRDGANLLVVQTNNATFGYTDESVQQLAMSRLRAVETGRSVVHISTVGVSALIAPDGRLLARSGHFTQQVLQARLPLRTGQTVATRLGEIPEALLAAIGLLLAAGALTRRRSGSSPLPSPSAPGRA